LDNAFVASANSDSFFIFGSEGSDTIDASSVTSAPQQIRVILRGGDDTYIGSASDEVFVFSNGQLNSSDTINGGAGEDAIHLDAGTIISASDLANVTGIESILFRGDGSITVTDSFVAQKSITFLTTVSNSDSDQTIDASGVGASAMSSAGFIYRTGGGSDTLTGSVGRDTFFFDAGKSELDASDVVDGGAGDDTLVISNTSGAAAAVSASDFANVSGIEFVTISSASDVTLELSDISDGAVLRVRAVGGNHTIDTTSLTAQTQITFGAGDNTLTDGAARTRVFIEADELTSTDSFDGGGGFDTLVLTQNGSVSASDLVNVTNFEQLLFRRGGTVEISDDFAQGSSFIITGSSGVEIVDGSAETSTWLRFRQIDTGDDLTGGAANDQFEINSTAFAAIDGGAGTLNRIYTNSSVASVDLTDPALTGAIDNIQVLDLGGADVTVNVDAASGYTCCRGSVAGSRSATERCRGTFGGVPGVQPFFRGDAVCRHQHQHRH
jgi:Ca2+-binding RTX toxin-like protein